AGVMIHDLGFLAAITDGCRGFRVFAGGGMGASSRLGRLLAEFLPAQDLGYCVAAVKGIFYRRGDRRNKHRNRLRFLLQDMGWPEFVRVYQEEFSRLKEKGGGLVLSVEEGCSSRQGAPGGPRHSAPAEDAFGPGQGQDKEYQDFLAYNVSSQKQAGYSRVLLRIPRGDISAGEMAALAALAGEFAGLGFNITQEQNLACAWVCDRDIPRLFSRLKQITQDFLYPRTLLDVVSCKGALTCNLGLCNSPGLAREIEKVIKDGFVKKAISSRLDIRVNGCPNACGHHPIGKIAFYGLARRVDNRPVPFYNLVLAGRKEGDKSALALEVGAVAAKNIPGFLREFLAAVDAKLRPEDDVYEFLRGKGVELARGLMGKYGDVPDYSRSREFYVDWGRREDFSLGGLGPGECGAGVLDVIQADLAEAKICLDKARDNQYPVEEIKRALHLAARALLIVKGVDPQSPQEAFCAFGEKFVDGGIADVRYKDISQVYERLIPGLGPQEAEAKFFYAQGFVGHIRGLYQNMDASLNFPVREKPTAAGHSADACGGQRFLDLKGTPCPINYVKAKLALEELPSGGILAMDLDNGEPIENVSASLKGDGHKIVEMKQQGGPGGHWRLVVKKQS
ncbi:MAG: sulfurtransferase TusA family protein, partial [Candidatus Omnitrophota bacterium]